MLPLASARQPMGATITLFAAWARETGGNMAIMLGLMVFPLFGAVGLAIDYSHAHSVKRELQSIADSAALAAKADGGLDATAITARAQTYIEANATRLQGVAIAGSDIMEVENGFRVTLDATVETSISRLFGYESFGVSVAAESRVGTDAIEIALVLDNTGSMAGSMGDLKDGAKSLVEAVFQNAGVSGGVKFAVVPYVGAVNIGNGATQMNWMDTTGDAKHHGGTMESFYFGYEPGCTWSPGGGAPVNPGAGTFGSLLDGMRKLAGIVGELIGVSPAVAATAADVPAPFGFSDPCWIVSPPKVNAFDFFNAIPNAQWKGCVEARAEPYDVTDEAPSSSNPDTLFVPWLWPDEPDNATLAAQGYSWTSDNDYLPDRLDLRDNLPDANGNTPGKFTDPWVGWGFNNVLKYNNTNGIAISETGPDTKGPNKACPDPVLPLTGEKAEIVGKIDSLSHWNGSGTNTAEGLAWGWRVLSPGEPFAEGAAYGETRKVIVLMTDGVNNVDPASHDRLSQYSAYGYLEQWFASRIPTLSYAGFKEHVDDRMSQICANAKASDITIYTVAFNVSDSTTLDLLTACATQPPYAYTAETAEELVEAFKQIASSLSHLRLAK